MSLSRPARYFCADVVDGSSDTLGCHSQMLGCSFRKPRACSRSRSVWLEPRVRPTWSISSVLKRPSAAMMPRWKFGMLSRMAGRREERHHRRPGVDVDLAGHELGRPWRPPGFRLAPRCAVRTADRRRCPRRSARPPDSRAAATAIRSPPAQPHSRAPAAGRRGLRPPRTQRPSSGPRPAATMTVPPRPSARSSGSNVMAHLTIRLVTKQGRRLLECRECS